MKDKQEHERFMKRYLDTIEKEGYQIKYNMSFYPPDDEYDKIKDPVRMIKLFCVSKQEVTPGKLETVYHFYEVTDNSIYSLESFAKYCGTREKLKEFIAGLHMRMVYFTKSEVLCALLRHGFNVDDVYRDNKIVFTVSRINILFNYANHKDMNIK